VKTLLILSISAAAVFFGLKAAKLEPWNDDKKSWVSKIESWTNKDGKTVELRLVETHMLDDELVGIFYTTEDKMVEIKSSQLSEKSISKLKECKPTIRKNNVYAKHLEGNLLKLDGAKLTKPQGVRAPRKYYVFYYTASWCPPCQKFTPTLVNFYNNSKTDDFEIVLITSDSDLTSMTKYAVSKKMKWPHLQLNKVNAFKKKFPSKLTTIPSIMVTDLEGNIITKGSAFAVMPSLKKILSN